MNNTTQPIPSKIFFPKPKLVEELEDLLDPVPEAIKKIFPGAKVVPKSELPDKLF